MTTTKNHFDALGLKAGANEDEIKKAYRNLARKWHPDKNSSPGAEEKFKEIKASYEYLASKDRREIHERDLNKPSKPPPQKPQQNGTQNKPPPHHHQYQTPPPRPPPPQGPSASSSSSSSSSKPNPQNSNGPQRPSKANTTSGPKRRPKDFNKFPNFFFNFKSTFGQKPNFSTWFERISKQFQGQNPPTNHTHVPRTDKNANINTEKKKGAKFYESDDEEDADDFPSFYDYNHQDGKSHDENPSHAYDDSLGYDFFSDMDFGVGFNITSPIPTQRRKSQTRNVAAESGYSTGLDDEYLFSPRRDEGSEGIKVSCPWCNQLFPRGQLGLHEDKCGKFGLSGDEDDDDNDAGLSNSDDEEDYLASLYRAKGNSRKPSWQQQHEDLLHKVKRDKMRHSNRMASQGFRNEGYVQCPYCERSFSSLTSQRHIPICKEHLRKYGAPLNPRRDAENAENAENAGNAQRGGKKAGGTYTRNGNTTSTTTNARGNSKQQSGTSFKTSNTQDSFRKTTNGMKGPGTSRQGAKPTSPKDFTEGFGVSGHSMKGGNTAAAPKPDPFSFWGSSSPSQAKVAPPKTSSASSSVKSDRQQKGAARRKGK